MAEIDLVRRDLEKKVGIKLPTEEDVKRAFGALYGLTGAVLDDWFAVAIGKQKSGTPLVNAEGVPHDDPQDVKISSEIAASLTVKHGH